ncbi:lipopolysaccharide kinase InaA family protein [Flavobacterium frigoris]|uniref:Lipopolysaccharide kinase (Kdo/WaaP) family protein n=1 Tax=Flavobacterium frigoris TaxID=229204 RepID=A0A1H9IXR4_FLAFI|nr:lipopolysaccharide kinase InaA family protein [Flavobacterium frigoris]SEQ79370.1 Lipopolysaccharide kinase (Kdo/WaaP) family protein [Flavobacterium frigoris]
MIIKLMFSTTVQNSKEILRFIKEFNSDLGTVFGNGDRNIIKLFELEEKKINVKSFKIPNIVNKVAYKYFRKSKAKRSFEYATILLEKGIGTPEPLAYFENFNNLGLLDSYYVSEHLQADLTFRELVEVPDYPDHDNILRQFTKFTFDLHQKGIEFLDHSPGNTLIKKGQNDTYSFYLVDLNRMNFHETMDFEMRMKNFSRLTPKKEMIVIMSNEYAKYYSESETAVFEKMWQFTVQFQDEFARKRRLKKKLKFWKS